MGHLFYTLNESFEIVTICVLKDAPCTFIFGFKMKNVVPATNKKNKYTHTHTQN